MKECPKCWQLFADHNLNFCRFDGSPLINEARHSNEAVTILFSTGNLNHRATPLDELRRNNESGKLYE